MIRYLLIVAVGVMTAYSVLRLIKNTQENWRSNLILIAQLFGLTLLLLALTGKLHILGLLLAGLIPVIRPLLPHFIRFIPILAVLKKKWSHHQIQTPFLSIQMNLKSGQAEAMIHQGQFKGLWLDQLNPEQLKSLMKECQNTDAEACRIIEELLGQTHHSQGPLNSNLTRNEALDILGLKEPVTQADIKTAHRKLIQKFHPDQGGSDYLAAKINQAKARLMSDLKN